MLNSKIKFIYLFTQNHSITNVNRTMMDLPIPENEFCIIYTYQRYTPTTFIKSFGYALDLSKYSTDNTLLNNTYTIIPTHWDITLIMSNAKCCQVTFNISTYNLH